MRIVTLVAGAAFAVAAFGTSATLAQSAPDWNGVSCADFTKMDAAGQASIASQIKPSDVAQSMTSNSGSTGSTNATTSTTADTPVQAGALVAACQASPNLSLHDIVSQPGAVAVPSN